MATARELRISQGGLRGRQSRRQPKPRVYTEAEKQELQDQAVAQAQKDYIIAENDKLDNLIAEYQGFIADFREQQEALQGDDRAKWNQLDDDIGFYNRQIKNLSQGRQYISQGASFDNITSYAVSKSSAELSNIETSKNAGYSNVSEYRRAIAKNNREVSRYNYEQTQKESFTPTKNIIGDDISFKSYTPDRKGATYNQQTGSFISKSDTFGQGTGIISFATPTEKAEINKPFANKITDSFNKVIDKAKETPVISYIRDTTAIKKIKEFGDKGDKFLASKRIPEKEKPFFAPKNIKKAYDWGAEQTLRAGEYAGTKTKSFLDKSSVNKSSSTYQLLFNPEKNPIKRETAKELISSAYMFSSLEPFMRTATAQQSQYADEVVETIYKGQKVKVLKSNVKKGFSNLQKTPRYRGIGNKRGSSQISKYADDVVETTYKGQKVKVLKSNVKKGFSNLQKTPRYRGIGNKRGSSQISKYADDVVETTYKGQKVKVLKSKLNLQDVRQKLRGWSDYQVKEWAKKQANFIKNNKALTGAEKQLRLRNLELIVRESRGQINLNQGGGFSVNVKAPATRTGAMGTREVNIWDDLSKQITKRAGKRKLAVANPLQTIKGVELKGISALETASTLFNPSRVGETLWTGTKPFQDSLTDTKQDSLTDTKQDSLTKQKSGLLSIPNIKIAQDSLTNQESLTRQDTTTIQDTITKQQTREDLRLGVFTTPKLNQRLRLDTGFSTPRTPRQPKKPKKPTPKKFPLPSSVFGAVGSSGTRDNRLQGFMPQVKERGKWKNVSKRALTKQTALALARAIVDNTTSSQGRILKSKKKPSLRRFPRQNEAKFRTHKIRKGKRYPLANTTRMKISFSFS